jgi:tetratricopeptide (TPR) repeat protein
MSRRAGLVALAPLLLLPRLVFGGAPLDEARALLAAYHEDPARIDRARDVLVAAVAAAEPTPETLIALARAWFLVGEFQATSTDERLAAYERGRDARRQAVVMAPRSDRAHLWSALNDGRWVELKGVMRALFALSRLRETTDTILALNPASVEAWILAGSLAANVPGFLGGDRGRAEQHFHRALALDPHRTGARLELARLYLATGRDVEARAELERLLTDAAPTDRPYWVLHDMPAARALLESASRGKAGR